MNFNPDTDIPDLDGKVILITGGTGGIGKTALLLLAKGNPAHLYFTGRNTKSADEVMEHIRKISPSTKTTFLRCDLGCRDTIRQAAEGFVSDRLDIFIANAGIMIVPPGLTSDGYEIKFGTNHMGNATLFRLLLPVMMRTSEQAESDVRFISLTSQGYGLHPRPEGILFEDLKTTQENLWLYQWATYGQSKLANIIYAKEVARRFPNITSIAIHPGVIKTDLVNGLDFFNKALVYVTNPFSLLTPEQGAYHTVWAATTRKGIRSGEYYEPIGKKKSGDVACNDAQLGKRLWEWTEKELEGFVSAC